MDTDGSTVMDGVEVEEGLLWTSSTFPGHQALSCGKQEGRQTSRTCPHAVTGLSEPSLSKPWALLRL